MTTATEEGPKTLNYEVLSQTFKKPAWLVLETMNGKGKPVKWNVFNPEIIEAFKKGGNGAYEFTVDKNEEGYPEILDAKKFGVSREPETKITPASGDRPTAPQAGRQLDPNVVYQNNSITAQVAIKAAAETTQTLIQAGAFAANPSKESSETIDIYAGEFLTKLAERLIVSSTVAHAKPKEENTSNVPF